MCGAGSKPRTGSGVCGRSGECGAVSAVGKMVWRKNASEDTITEQSNKSHLFDELSHDFAPKHILRVAPEA